MNIMTTKKPLYLQPGAKELSPALRDMLDYIDQFGPCNLADLFGKFGVGSRRCRDSFRGTLTFQVNTGYLKTSGSGTERRWSIGFDAPAPCAPAAPRTPPPQYDLRRAPVYVPARSAAPRAGSLDFKRIASHGYGC